jgi:hypothetical protein
MRAQARPRGSSRQTALFITTTAGAERRAREAREQLAVKVEGERSSSYLSLHVGEPTTAPSRFPGGKEGEGVL